ncbi:hypothetical protein BH10PAT2_BH10PAT2_3640 [soil metagenome]
MSQNSPTTRINSVFSKGKNTVTRFIDQHPLSTFFILLFLLIGFAVLGNKIRTPAVPPTSTTPEVKLVETYQLSGSPSIAIQAKVEKSGTITLVAQSAGIVQKISKKEGDAVQRGTTIISLSTSYQGGNISSLSRQIAQKSYQFQSDNYNEQVNLINKQRDVANKVNTQGDELREINRQSQDATKSLINVNTDLYNSIDGQLVSLSADNADHANEATILQLQQAKAGVQSAINNLQSGERTLEYQSADDKTPAAIADVQRDLTLEQLDLQQKMLDLNKDISGLNLKVSQVSEALMYPASPCPGTVERVYVKVGQAVSPGTVLATIKGTNDQATAVALVPQQVAQNISRIDATEFTISDQKVLIVPSYVSQEPTDGTLFSVIYHIPTQYSAVLANNNWLSLNVPLSSKTSHIAASIPLDSVYQTQAQSYVYVVDSNQQGSPAASVRQVELGQVFGQYVEVKNGLQSTDKVIVDRNVLDGDLIQTK